MRKRTASIAAVAGALIAAAVAPAPAARNSVAGVPTAQVGVHGPNVDHLSNLELVAHVPMKPPGVEQDGLGNNGAPALVGDCAYVGRWHDYGTARAGNRGVMIVDVGSSSPTYLQIVGEVVDTRVPDATPREIRAVDAPGGIKLLVVMTFSNSIANRPNRQMNTLRFFDASDCRRPALLGMFDFLAHRPHEFFLWLDPDRTHDVGGRPRMLVYTSVPIEAPSIWVIDATDPRSPRLAGTFDALHPAVSPEESGLVGDYAHSISVSTDGTRAHLSYWDGGYLTVDTSDFARGLPAGVVRPLGAASIPYDYSPSDVGNTHSAVEVAGTRTVVLGDEVYGGIDGCPYGWLRVVDTGSATRPPRQIGEYRLAENLPSSCDPATKTLTHAFRNERGLPVDGTFSMHNQTVVGPYVLASWYGGGMRIVDVSEPTEPVEVGMFVPAPLASVRTTSAAAFPSGEPFTRTDTSEDDWLVETWSYPIVRDGLIYVTDIRNGLYILRPASNAPFAETVAATTFAEGNSNIGSVPL